MSSIATNSQGLVEYDFFKMYDDTYEEGDDDRCPACGTDLCGDYRDLSFNGGIIQVIYTCPKCEKNLTFNYYLQNVIAE